MNFPDGVTDATTPGGGSAYENSHRTRRVNRVTETTWLGYSKSAGATFWEASVLPFSPSGPWTAEELALRWVSETESQNPAHVRREEILVAQREWIREHQGALAAAAAEYDWREVESEAFSGVLTRVGITGLLVSSSVTDHIFIPGRV